MKKVLALIMAVAMVMTMGVVAFAAEIDADLMDRFKADEPYVESGDRADVDTVKPGKSVYYFLGDTSDDKAAMVDALTDEDLFKISLDKGDDNAKWISSIKLVQKKFDDPLIKLSDGTEAGKTAGRHWFIELKTKDFMTDDEYKVSPEVTVTAKEDMTVKGNVVKDGDKSELKLASFWISNIGITTDDETWSAGTGGVIVKPLKNEETVVEWEDENDVLARLTFDADSDVSKYFPKLSTKWDNVKYAELFNDQDAFVRQWVGTPSISSTSRATLELIVPYVDEDDELTVDEGSIIVYEETEDGELIDITDKGSFDYNDDDEYVFTMKTRQLGTYIFAEAPVTEAADDEVPADEVPVDTDKVNPGTGF